MSTNHRARLLCLGSAVALALMLIAPVAVSAEDDVAVLAPVTAPSVEDTSADDVRAATRAIAAQRALLTGDIGSMQEERLLAIVAAAPSWDDTSGYGSVEASRATIGHPTSSTTNEAALLAQFRAIERALSLSPGADQQVPADVRWAPVPAIAPESSVEESRVLAAQQALQSYDLGSLQEEALLAVVAAGPSWDETSGYGAVEAARAQR
jgi:hypothetical protein